MHNIINPSDKRYNDFIYYLYSNYSKYYSVSKLKNIHYQNEYDYKKTILYLEDLSNKNENENTSLYWTAPYIPRERRSISNDEHSLYWTTPFTQKDTQPFNSVEQRRPLLMETFPFNRNQMSSSNFLNVKENFHDLLWKDIVEEIEDLLRYDKYQITYRKIAKLQSPILNKILKMLGISRSINFEQSLVQKKLNIRETLKNKLDVISI